MLIFVSFVFVDFRFVQLRYRDFCRARKPDPSNHAFSFIARFLRLPLDLIDFSKLPEPTHPNFQPPQTSSYPLLQIKRTFSPRSLHTNIIKNSRKTILNKKALNNSSSMILGGTSVFFVVVCSKTPKTWIFIRFNSNQQIQFFKLILGLLTGRWLSFKRLSQ